jgi:hypothetical protein
VLLFWFCLIIFWHAVAWKVDSLVVSSQVIAEVNNCTVVHISGEKMVTQIRIEPYKRRGLISWKRGAARHMFRIEL